MLEKIKSSIGYVVTGIIAILYALFKYEQKKAIEKGAQLRNAEAEKKDTQLDGKQDTNDALIKDVQSDAEKDKKHKLTPEEMVDFLKKI